MGPRHRIPSESRKVVHHSLYFLDTSGDARKFDARDPKPGYSGMGRSNRQFQSLGGWAVGGESLMLPSELAWHFPTNSDLVLQTHFHPNGKPDSEISSVGIYFADKPPTRKFTTLQLPPLFGRISGLEIPAGATNYTIKDSFTVPVDLEAFAVSPHAHYLGKTFLLTATLPDGAVKTLLKISDWDFNWQEDCAFKHRVPYPRARVWMQSLPMTIRRKIRATRPAAQASEMGPDVHGRNGRHDAERHPGAGGGSGRASPGKTGA
jgi:hypothetical protein